MSRRNKPNSPSIRCRANPKPMPCALSPGCGNADTCRLRFYKLMLRQAQHEELRGILILSLPKDESAGPLNAGASHADIAEAELRHLGGAVDVAQVDHQRRLERGFHLGEVQ